MQSRELGFIRDTFEKVCRLTDILKFFESDALLAEVLALKGGTAINLTVFNLPRLSVDTDLDYCRNVSKDEREIMRLTGYRAPGQKLFSTF
jgi:predicted nucleotidyltransferase component of viral defense system